MNVLQRSAERHFHQASAADFSDQRKNLCAGTLRAAGFREPGGTVRYDGRDVVPGLDIINVGWFALEPLLRRERRTRPRTARTAFERSNQRGFFAANERTRAFHEFDVELEAAAENVIAEQAVFTRPADRAGQTVHGERVFGAN